MENITSHGEQTQFGYTGEIRNKTKIMNREIGIWNITMDRWVIDDRSMIPEDLFRTTHFHKAVTAINQIRHLEMAFKMAMKRRSCSFELRYLDNNEPVNES